MKYILAGIMLAVMMFVFLVLAIVTHPMLDLTQGTIEDLSEGESFEENITDMHTLMNRVFWLMFFLSTGGLCVWYLLGSHETEHEQYRTRRIIRRRRIR